jgi:hypothetical protein
VSSQNFYRKNEKQKQSNRKIDTSNTQIYKRPNNSWKKTKKAKTKNKPEIDVALKE